jgi:hypothetical protein
VLLAVVVLLAVAGCSTQPKDSSTKAEPPVASAPSDSPPPESELASEIPLTASEEDSLRDQVERNWNLGSLTGSPKLKDMLVKLRLHLLPDGTVTSIDVLNDQPGNPLFRQVAESAIRAVMVSSPLNLAGRRYDSMIMTFHPDQRVE